MGEKYSKLACFQCVDYKVIGPFNIFFLGCVFLVQPVEMYNAKNLDRLFYMNGSFLGGTVWVII